MAKQKRRRSKVAKLGVNRAKGYLYYVDKQGNLARKGMKWSNKSKRKQIVKKKVVKKKDKSCFYFLDKQGDVSKSCRI